MSSETEFRMIRYIFFSIFCSVVWSTGNVVVVVSRRPCFVAAAVEGQVCFVHESISQIFYVQLLRRYSDGRKLQSQTVNSEKLFKNTFIWITAQTMLMKLTPWINLANILQAAFCKQVFFSTFLCLQYGIVTFWCKEIGDKAALKI